MTESNLSRFLKRALKQHDHLSQDEQVKKLVEVCNSFTDVPLSEKIGDLAILYLQQEFGDDRPPRRELDFLKRIIRITIDKLYVNSRVSPE